MASAEPGSRVARNGSAIEEIVSRLDRLLRAVEEVPGADRGASELKPDMIDAARRMLKAEQGRAELFGADMFPNPGWAILLHLFVSGAEGRAVNAAAACAAAGVPENVALRHVAVLVAAKLVRRQPQQTDPEAIYLKLTQAGEKRLCDYFSPGQRGRDAAAA